MTFIFTWFSLDILCGFSRIGVRSIWVPGHAFPRYYKGIERWGRSQLNDWPFWIFDAPNSSKSWLIFRCQILGTFSIPTKIKVSVKKIQDFFYRDLPEGSFFVLESCDFIFGEESVLGWNVHFWAFPDGFAWVWSKYRHLSWPTPSPLAICLIHLLYNRI